VNAKRPPIYFSSTWSLVTVGDTHACRNIDEGLNMNRLAPLFTLLPLLAAGLGIAQDRPQGPPPYTEQQNPPNAGGWRKVGEPPPQPADSPAPAYEQDQNQRYPNEAAGPRNDQYQNGRPGPRNDPYQNGRPDPRDEQNYQVPPRLTLRSGTFVTVRMNQPLSSDRNQPGDAFSATLVNPVVVDGVVVAQPGETVGGRVSEAQKAGRVEGTSRLAIQLTDLTLADGTPVPIRSQLISRRGPTSEGRDAGAIAGTTALGAAIGAGADWGRGAAIGAGAGAVIGTIGVLLTRGHPTVIYPESVLTFRIEEPVTISTERAPQAFRYVEPNEYDRPSYAANRPPPPPRARVGYAYPPPPPPYYYPRPYYYGPSFGFYYGSGFYRGPRYYLGRRYYRRW
jgi:hypothetical protein